MIKFPEDYWEREKIYAPYLEGCHLVPDAPPEAIKAHEENMEWILKNTD